MDSKIIHSFKARDVLAEIQSRSCRSSRKKGTALYTLKKTRGRHSGYRRPGGQRVGRQSWPLGREGEGAGGRAGGHRTTDTHLKSTGYTPLNCLRESFGGLRSYPR
jgi:hypothetical protein